MELLYIIKKKLVHISIVLISVDERNEFSISYMRQLYCVGLWHARWWKRWKPIEHMHEWVNWLSNVPFECWSLSIIRARIMYDRLGMKLCVNFALNIVVDFSPQSQLLADDFICSQRRVNEIHIRNEDESTQSTEKKAVGTIEHYTHRPTQHLQFYFIRAVFSLPERKICAI